MAILALAAPTAFLGSAYTAAKVGANSGLLLPAVEQNAVGTITGFSFPNNGAIMLRLVTGTVIGTLTFQPQLLVEGALPAAVVPTSAGSALAISSAYIFGPFDTAEWNDPNGLFQCQWTGFTGGSFGLYLLPAGRYGQ
jgi:hypothetical protein